MKRWTTPKYGRDLEDVFTHFNRNLSLNSWQVKRRRMSYTFNKLVVCIIFGGTLLLVSKGASGNIAPYFTQEPSDIIVIKKRSAVLNCSVEGIPRPTISWFQDGTEMLLKGDSRRRILPDGSLYFSSITHTKSSRPDEGRYQCRASSRIRNQDYIILSRSAHLRVAGMSSKVVLEPASQQVIFGDVARLLCRVRHSMPKAKITWKFKQKNGTYISITSNNKHTLLDNGVLQIRNVQWSDAGEYVCTATNKLAMRNPSSNAAILTVDADKGNTRRLDFVASPTNTNTTKGSRVVLECALRGNPKPSVEWYKNAQLITYDNRIKILGEGNLEITSAMPDDDGEYKCQGSAGRLSMYKSVTLQVHYPPTFTSKPSNKKAHVDDTVKFKCVVDGRPTPNVSWFKNGYKLPPSTDYMHFAPGSMTVEMVLPSDTGIYQCVASNYLGEEQASAELSVFEKGILIPTAAPTTTTPPPTTTIQPTTPSKTMTPPSRLPGKPQNVRAKTLSSTEIEVSWDPPLQTNGKILFYHIFFTYAEGGGGVARLENTTKTSKIFRNLKPNTKFRFRVYAQNSYGTGPISFDAIGQTASAGKPPAMPTSLVAVPLSSSQIKVQWAEPPSEKEITEYFVEYQEVIQASGAKTSSFTTNRQFTLKSLKTYTQYKIWVYAVNKDDVKSQPAVTIATTYGGVPKGKPRGLVVKGDGTGTGLLVTWKPVHHSLVNGRITKYLLEYRRKNKRKIKRKIKRVDLPASPLHYTLMRLSPNTVYEVRMTAGTDSGYGDATHWVQANTSVTKCSESRNPGRPTDLQLSIIALKSRSMIKIEWQAPVDASQFCVTGYIVEYGEGTPFHQKNPVNASTTQYLAKEGISPGRTYVVKVVAINNNKDNGPNIQEEIVIPPSSDIKKGVKDVRVTPLTSRALKVDWVETSDRISVVYHVYHSFKKAVVYCGNTTSKTIDCSGLKPYTFYTVYVRRHGENVNSTGMNRTKEETPSPPTDITGSQAEDNTTDLFLHWQIPEQINGKILQYRIHYSTNMSLSLDQWEKVDSNGSAMMTRVKNLVPGKKYYFKMQVRNGAGWSDASKAKMIMIKDKGSPTEGPTGDINAQAAGSGELRDKTLWIVIAAVAGVTLIAIIVISVVLCKKRSGEDQSPRKARKPPPSYKSAVIANGSVKKKREEKPPDLWINHTENMEMKPLNSANPPPDVTNIPRSSREMRPLKDHPIDQIKLDHERCSFRKDSLEMEPDAFPPPPLHLLDEDDDDVPSPIAMPNRAPYRPVVNYPRPSTPDNGPRYPAYPLTSTPRHLNTVPRSESFDTSREPDVNSPLLRCLSDDFDRATKDKPAPIYAVPKPKPKPMPLNEPTQKVPPPTKPKPTGPTDDIKLPSVGYSTPTGVYRVPNGTQSVPPKYDENYTPQRKDTRVVAAELDHELAGLEGLMKDLNAITSNDYLT